MRWASDLKLDGSRPNTWHCVVSLDKKLYPTLSLSIQVNKMGTGNEGSWATSPFFTFNNPLVYLQTKN